MASLKLTIKLSAADTFEVEVADDEQSQTLGAMIYSLRPAVGENPRVVHKGKVLREDQTLKDAGVQDKDAIACVRRPAATPAPSSGMKLEAPPRVPEKAPEAAPAVSEACSAPVPASSVDVPVTEAVATPEPAAPIEAQGDAKPAAAEDAKMEEESNPEKKQRTDEHPAAEAAAASAEAGKETPASPSMVRQTSGESQASSSIHEDYSSPDGLQALARRLESNPAAFSVERTTQALRAAAEKIHALEEQKRELASTLYMMHMVSAQSLQKLVGEGGEGGGPGLQRQQSEGDGRSFMFQKGDAETMEMHAAAAAKRPTMTGGVCGGGTLSSKPTSREEMEQARKARLAKLEADQAEKRKEQEEAAEKAKSREAMFNRPNVGPSKPLGKY